MNTSWIVWGKSSCLPNAQKQTRSFATNKTELGGNIDDVTSNKVEAHMHTYLK